MAGLIRSLIAHASGMPLGEATRKYGRGFISGVSRAVRAGKESKKKKKEEERVSAYLQKLKRRGSNPYSISEY